jgi:transcriptional regulator with XRE-family HTH domain
MGLRIKNRRNVLRLSQEKLAEATCVTTSYIGQIERAERIPSLETLVNIAKSLRVSVDYFLQDTIAIESDKYIKQIGELLIDKSDKTKAAAIEIINALLMHID